MIEHLRRLSATAEFVIVLIGALARPTLVSVVAVLHAGPPPRISDGTLLALIFEELVVLGVLWPFLLIRGWNARRLGLSMPTPGGTLLGIGVFIVAEIAFLVTWGAAAGIVDMTAAQARISSLVAPDISIGIAAAVSLINPVFEEVFVCGYVIAFLSERSHAREAIGISVAIRTLYHMYQGPLGVITNVPLGLVFAVWYVRSRQLWPVMVAHAMFDFFALVVISG
jgi:membrane protease YdiL (CAAX protease family)